MNTFTFKPKGVCSSQMTFEMEDDIIISVKVIGGCSGNLQGICNLLKNKSIDEVVAAFDGVKCGMKSTSCPEQMAIALSEYRKVSA